MKVQEKTQLEGWKVNRILLLALVALGLLDLMNVGKVLAQVSRGSSISSGVSFTPILSGDGLRLGPLVVHPFLSADASFTDNAFRSKTNRRSDVVNTISPGLQAQLPFAGSHQAIIDYRSTQSFSQRFSSNNVPRSSLTGQLMLNFPVGFKLQLQGGYTKGFDARGSAVDVQASNPTRWSTTSFVGEIDTLGRQFGVRIRVNAIDWKFKNNNQAPRRDRLNSRVDLALFKAISPKTFALFSVGVTRQVYDQNTQLDSVNYRISSGLRWRATGKTTGEIQVGYAFLNFDRAPVTQPAGSLLSSGGTRSQNLRITGNINWKATARSNIRLRPFRIVRQSGVFNTSTFTQTGLNLNARHEIGSRTSLNGNFRYAHDDFDNDAGNQTTQNRIDQRLQGGIGVSYQVISWLGISGQYQYEQRWSTVTSNEFYANTLIVSLQGVF